MSIVSSAYVVGVPQASGKSYITVTHTLAEGAPIVTEFGPVGVVDYQLIADGQAAQINEQLAEDEANALLES